ALDKIALAVPRQAKVAKKTREVQWRSLAAHGNAPRSSDGSRCLGYEVQRPARARICSGSACDFAARQLIRHRRRPRIVFREADFDPVDGVKVQSWVDLFRSDRPVVPERDRIADFERGFP